MIENLPIWISVFFVMTVIVELIFFHFSNGQPNKLTFIIVLWSILQFIIASTGFYQDTTAFPPKFALAVGPPFLLLIYGLVSKNKKWILEKRNITLSTFLHTERLLLVHSSYCPQSLYLL